MNTINKLLCLLALVCTTLPLTGCDTLEGTSAFSGKYRAVVWLRVAKDRPRILFDSQSEVHYLNDRNAQPILIRSAIVLDIALQLPGIAQLECLKNKENKVAWLAEQLEVKFLGDTEILEIAITGENKEELIKILMAVRLAYMDRVVAVDRELDMRRRMTLEQAYKNTEKMITRKSIQCRTLEDQLTTPNSQSTSHAWMQSPMLAPSPEVMRHLQIQLSDRATARSGLNAKIAALETRLAKISEEHTRDMTSKVLSEDPLLSEWELEAKNKAETLDKLMQNAENPDDNPEVLALQNQIVEHNRKIQSRMQELTPEIEKMVKDKEPASATCLREEIDQAMFDHSVCAAEMDTLTKSLRQIHVTAEMTNRGSRDLDNLRSELARMERMYQQMGQQLDEWTIESGAAQRVQTITEPMATRIR